MSKDISTPSKILVIRNDKLGDFMLAWPALSLLKQQYPETEIAVLIPSYTRPMAELCPWIDNILIDDQRVSTISDARHLSGIIKKHNFDASITLFSEFRVALALWLSHIPLRFAPATKLWQILYNNTLVQRRSRSDKPEYIYNVDLIRHFIRTNNSEPKQLKEPPFLSFDQKKIDRLRTEFLNAQNLGNNSKLVFIHPGSGGSAANLNIQQYAELITNLSVDKSLHFVITAGPGEDHVISQLAELLVDCSHTLYISNKGLKKYALFLSIADLFISGSTGVLHIAGALNVHTVAFYTNRQSATSLRWQTLNTENFRLAFSPDRQYDDGDMSSIDVGETCEKIREKFFEATGNYTAATSAE